MVFLFKLHAIVILIATDKLFSLEVLPIYISHQQYEKLAIS